MTNGDSSRWMPSVLDREIDNREADAFGHQHFSEALRSLVESNQNRPPYSIGLLGGWGTGKSTIKRLYIESLMDDANRDSSGYKRSDRLHVVTFNAWRFGGEDIKRALLRHVFLELGGDRHALQDALFRHIEQVATEARSWREVGREILDKWVFSLLQILLPFGLVLGLLIGVASWVPNIPPAVYALMFVASVWALVYALKHYFSSARFLVAGTSPTKRVEVPQTSSEQYEDLLLDQMATFKAAQRACERVIVFVDDLDRLSAEEMVSGLDAVRTFLEIPESQAPQGLGVVFVISCDENRVAQAIAGKQRRLGGAELPGSVFNRTDARRFLDRIFQFRLEIPSFPQRDMRSFAESKLRGSAPAIIESLETRGVPIEDVIDRMIHAGVRSPRNAIQIVNAFIQSWWLAAKREQEGAGTKAVGGLAENAVTAHPITLAALSALRVDFPDFYADLQEDASLIRRVENIAFRGSTVADEPPSTQPVLRQYLDADSGEFKEAFRPLRQFLASLGGMRWPESLQAHLQLAQDPWTRRLGDRAYRLYEAFVSGDTASVLSEFGRGHDQKSLQRDDCRKLRDLESDLYRETPIRRNNAAVVLAELLPRMPEEEAPSLMTPLAKRLADSAELRSRVGVARMKGILEFASPGDRRHVAETLIGDFCRSEEEVEFRLETGEPPSLDEAVAAAREAVSLALSVRAGDGISQEADNALRDWLASRRVAAAGRELVLPFADLEGWVSEHEENLLGDFAPAYLDLLCGQFEADDVESFDSAGSLRRVARILRRLQVAGEDSRVVLKEHAPRFASVRSSDSVQCVTSFLLEFVEQLDSMSLNAVVAAVAKRAERGLSSEEGWSLDGDFVEETLVTVVDSRGADLDDAARAAVVGVASRLGVVADRGDTSVRLGAALGRCDAEDDLYDSWVGELLGSLSLPCVRYVAAEFASRLTAEERQKAVAALRPLVKTDNVTEGQRNRHAEFMAALTPDGASTTELQSHLAALLPVIAQRHGNPNGYLFSVFPAVAKVIGYCPAGPLGEMLQTLFVQVRGNPELFGCLHSEMVGRWPRPTGETGPYDPETLFAQGIEFLTSQPQSEGAGGVLLSLGSMATGGVVADQEAVVADAATRVWPGNREAASSVLKALGTLPPTDSIAGLGDGVDHSDAEDVGHLRDVWEEIAQGQPSAFGIEVALAILQREAVVSDSSPDANLDLWIEIQGASCGEMLEEVAVADGLNDAQRTRVLGCAERAASEVGLKFFSSVLPAILSMEAVPTAVRAALDSKTTLNSVFGGAGERHELGEALLRGLLGSSSVEVKNRVGEWLRDLGAHAVVERTRSYGEPNAVDVDALAKAFPELRKKLNMLRPSE